MSGSLKRPAPSQRMATATRRWAHHTKDWPPADIQNPYRWTSKYILRRKLTPVAHPEAGPLSSGGPAPPFPNKSRNYGSPFKTLRRR
jgi:hypothetical protein